MILKNLLTNTYYISPEIIILFGIFVATLTGVFIKKNSVGTTCNLVILTFIISKLECHVQKRIKIALLKKMKLVVLLYYDPLSSKNIFTLFNFVFWQYKS